jgi:hypothetical protein
MNQNRAALNPTQSIPQTQPAVSGRAGEKDRRRCPTPEPASCLICLYAWRASSKEVRTGQGPEREGRRRSRTHLFDLVSQNNHRAARKRPRVDAAWKEQTQASAVAGSGCGERWQPPKASNCKLTRRRAFKTTKRRGWGFPHGTPYNGIFWTKGNDVTETPFFFSDGFCCGECCWAFQRLEIRLQSECRLGSGLREDVRRDG